MPAPPVFRVFEIECLTLHDDLPVMPCLAAAPPSATTCRGVKRSNRLRLDDSMMLSRNRPELRDTIGLALDLGSSGRLERSGHDESDPLTEQSPPGAP